MAQSQATTQGTKRRYSGFSSPQTSPAEEPEARRRPPNPPPGATNGLQPPQVGVSVVTVDMFREYQNQVLAEFDRQSNQIAALRERTQAMESRVQSLEDAEDMAIDAVRDIRDGVLPRVDGHQESLDALSTAVARHNTLLEALGSQGQEDRASQRRDAPARTPLPSWRPGLLGNATDSTKSTMEEVKAQIAKNLASLTDHERHLEDNDSCLGNHRRHLADHEKRLGGHDTRITALDKHLSEHMIHRLAQDRRCGEHNARLTAQEGHIRDHDMCVAKHNERLGALDKAVERTHFLTGAKIRSWIESCADLGHSAESPAAS
ncbi:hypothetical protein GGR50DRAFT_492065 [Xylaria sp. CBS 124048]|nr:hypothetical protein GGR50DRAFT_492065 [Xylaria sp. CBS 124048]